MGAIRDRSSMRGGQRGKRQLFVQGKIEGHEYDVMLDTGASHNVLCLNRLPLRLQQLLWSRAQPSSRTITGAGGQETPTAGETHATVQIVGVISRIKAVILDDCPYGVIVGMPDLRRLGASLDLATGTVQLRGQAELLPILAMRMENEASGSLGRLPEAGLPGEGAQAKGGRKRKRRKRRRKSSGAATGSMTETSATPSGYDRVSLPSDADAEAAANLLPIQRDSLLLERFVSPNTKAAIPRKGGSARVEGRLFASSDSGSRKESGAGSSTANERRRRTRKTASIPVEEAEGAAGQDAPDHERKTARIPARKAEGAAGQGAPDYEWKTARLPAKEAEGAAGRNAPGKEDKRGKKSVRCLDREEEAEQAWSVVEDDSWG